MEISYQIAQLFQLPDEKLSKKKCYDQINTVNLVCFQKTLFLLLAPLLAVISRSVPNGSSNFQNL
jgi:hypothetical protein